MATIDIPQDLKPADGRFGSGPSKVRAETIDALVKVAPTYLGTSHRQAPVRQVVARVRKGLAQFFSLPEDYEIVLGNGGATLFWDLATFGLIERKSQHASFGEFSSKFAAAAAAAPHLESPQVFTSEVGTHPDHEANEEIDVYALTQNETSTGVEMPVRRPRHHDGTPASGLVLVDATSAAGGLRVDPAEYDAYYFSPQKSFGSDGGLWLACCAPTVIERAERIAATGRFIPAMLDFNLALENSRLDQTYNTPALITLLLLAEQVEWFNANGGLEWAASRADASSEILYAWAEASSFATPFVQKPDQRSRVVGTIDFAEGTDAAAIAKVLRENGIVDTEPYRRLGRNQLRIAMYPGVDPSDVEALTHCIDYVVERLG